MKQIFRFLNDTIKGLSYILQENKDIFSGDLTYWLVKFLTLK